MPNSPMHYAFTASQEQFIYQRGRGTGIWIGIGMGIDRDAAREWNGMECPPQVPPYEPSKNHVEITLPKGHEIDPGPKPENPEE